MPLRALNNGEAICAFEQDDVSWLELKNSYKTLNLLMPCCSTRAIPKTSKLGNYFFSHSERADCSSAPESQEHIYLKTLLARAAKSAGWSVVTEWAGVAENGERWIADVYCEKNGAKVALEVQLSHQTEEEFVKRQNIYKRSGVRAAWFVSETRFKGMYIEQTKELPIFYILPFDVSQEPQLKAFNVSVFEFAKALLSKRVAWTVDPWDYVIYYLEDTCWKCHETVKQVYGSAVGVYGESAMTVPHASRVLESFDQFINKAELHALGLNGIGCFEKLKGNAPGYPYCNTCIHCGAPQNNHYLMKYLEEGSRAKGTAFFTSVRHGVGAWRMKSEPTELAQAISQTAPPAVPPHPAPGDQIPY